MAKCPAHPDKHPSLQISQGERGALLRCWAGCDIETVVKAAGLRMADLFAGPPPSAGQARQAAQEHERRDAEARQRRIAHGRACDSIHKLEAVASTLGAKLMRLPDDSPNAPALTRLFHNVQDWLHMAEVRETELRA
jgi:hypothetical protein